MSTALERFDAAFKRLIERGEYPGPTALNKELGRGDRPIHQNTLNGKESKRRRELMVEYGIVLMRQARHEREGIRL